MRIGFDAKRAMQNFTGLGNYSRYLIEILYRFHPENEYLLYAPKYRESRQFQALQASCPTICCRYPEGFWRRLKSLWRTFGITRRLERDGVDIYHGLSNELPLNIRRQRRAKSVVTIHDLIFVRYPQYYGAIDRWLYRYKYGRSCRNADAIIAISECTKRDIVNYFKIAPEKIHVIYQGCDSSFTSIASEAIRQEVRNKAMPRLPEEVHLVIVGKRTAYTDEVERFIEENHLRERVHLLHDVIFRHLPAVYQMAEIFVYPSRFEGFGIPILEALHSSVPVIAATGSCLEEAGGPDSIYVHPDDVEGMTAALTLLVEHPEKRRYMVEQGKRYAARFSEERQARQLVELYQALL